jgi:glyoxylate carboligase
MVTLSRIAAVASRLLRRNRRPAAVDSLGVVLAAASETGAVVTIPGLAAWLGYETAPDDADFMASIVGGFTESFEDYCTRISRKEAAS